MEIWAGKLNFAPCDALNDVSPEAVQQANAFLSALGDSEKAPFEQLLRVATAMVWKSQSREKEEGTPCATLTPFIYQTELSGGELERAMLQLVAHEPLHLAEPTLQHMLENPLEFPVGFFACSEQLEAVDGSAVRSELVPYCASACQLGVCLHLPKQVAAALKHPQAKRHGSGPGRLLVRDNVVAWRPLERDDELDAKTRDWVANRQDCLVVTEVETSNSFLIAEP